ncbi:NAD-dependent epimerase/dehydratase family protein [Vibrio splendidus]|uniref:NAD-dependent epimerase/dehydratase family protein n=1 Tax=Vibrio splendidus TaxID=29497 RepID=UPI000C836AAD|nr:NAD-dependent epimerase/dehydratase family protein [Vibrio splendidus]PMK12105.1 hypothetical protein BCU08_05145 [Vibrio splendidus]
MQSSNAKLAITGANGFIGKHFVKRLKNTNINFVSLDNRYPFDIEPSLVGVNTIIHLAGLAHGKANSEELSFSINCLYPICLAKLAKHHGVNRFIFVSSANVNSIQKNPFFDGNAHFKSQDFAALHKLKAEQALLKLVDTEFSVVILRLPLVYAADAPANFSKLLSLALKLPVQPFGLANAKRSYLSIDNLTSALAHLVDDKSNVTDVFNLTDDCDLSTKDLISGIRTAFGYSTRHLPIPPNIIRLPLSFIGKSNLLDIFFNENRLDITKFKNTFGWNPVEKPSEALNKLREQ